MSRTPALYCAFACLLAVPACVAPGFVGIERAAAAQAQSEPRLTSYLPGIDLIGTPAAQRPLPMVEEVVETVPDEAIGGMNHRERLVLRGRCETILGAGGQRFFIVISHDGSPEVRPHWNIMCADGYVRVSCPPGQQSSLMSLPEEQATRRCANFENWHFILPTEGEIDSDGIFQLVHACR